MKVHDIIKRSMRWRIADGREVYVSNEQWLPNDQNECVETDLGRNYCDLKVCSLMKVGSREWDEDIINDLFDERDKI